MPHTDYSLNYLSRGVRLTERSYQRADRHYIPPSLSNVTDTLTGVQFVIREWAVLQTIVNITVKQRQQRQQQRQQQQQQKKKKKKKKKKNNNNNNNNNNHGNDK